MKFAALIATVVVLADAPAVHADTTAFRTDILPVLTKAGCNAGACHGAATGQGGFKLSLLGYDPEEDYERITRELGGRRIDVGHPGESLVLRKPSGELDHEGGRRLRRDSDGHSLLRQWIAAGAPFGPRDLKVTSIEVEPADSLVEAPGQSRQLRVTAVHSDGTHRDVTGLALYTSNDDAIVEVGRGGEVTTVGKGLTSVMVRYSGQVAAARVAVPLGDRDEPANGFAAVNYVDEHVRAELVRLRVPASPLSDDAEFLRRIFLDLTGRLPEVEVVRQFLTRPASPEKRAQLVDQLLGSEAFVDFWTYKLGDLLLVSGKGEGMKAYHDWLRRQVAADTPFDSLVTSLLTATGELRSVGPANYLTLARDPRDLSEHVGRMFLGAQIACARCHAHPADRWTQDDYHAFAAYFARVTVDDGILSVANRGEVDHPKTALPVAPRPLGELENAGPGDADRRTELASWLTSARNPYFAKTLANRVWKQLLGRGLVEPVDDLRPTNPASHPALLSALAGDFAANGFKLRPLVRRIVSSRTYQLSSRSQGLNRSDAVLYSHAYVKELSAPVFADAVAQVTGIGDAYDGCPAGTRAVQLAGPATPSPALDVLGRCPRRRSCEGPTRTGGGLAEALHLINGSTINDKLSGGIAGQLGDRKPTEVVEELYLRALSRMPEGAELKAWEETLSNASTRTEGIQDLLWALLNSREFAFNR